MRATLQPGRVLFAAAMVALGITGLVNGDFALVRQNVPAHLPRRTSIAWVCAVIELAAGLGLLFERTQASANRILVPYMVLWVVLLKIPGVVRSPLDAGAWGGIGEIGTMAVGAWCLFAAHAGSRESRQRGSITGPSGIRAARWLLVLTLPMLGAEVIVDAVKAGGPRHAAVVAGVAVPDGVGGAVRRRQHRGVPGDPVRCVAAARGDARSGDGGRDRPRLLGAGPVYRPHRNHRIHHHVPGCRGGVGGSRHLSRRAVVGHRTTALEGVTR